MTHIDMKGVLGERHLVGLVQQEAVAANVSGEMSGIVFAVDGVRGPDRCVGDSQGLNSVHRHARPCAAG